MKRLTNSEYGFIFSRVPRLCLDFVIKNRDGVLLVKRTIEPYKGYWHLPGGMVRYGESVNNASKRILRDEIGVTPVKIKLIGSMEFPNDNQNGLRVHSVSMVFWTRLSKNKSGRDGKIFKFLPVLTHPIHKLFLSSLPK